MQCVLWILMVTGYKVREVGTAAGETRKLRTLLIEKMCFEPQRVR